MFRSCNEEPSGNNLKTRKAFRRSKKGMSTIFGALFFIILTLMGFNLILWNFIQYDAYNTVITSMQQRDLNRVSEDLVPKNPGANNFTSNTFNIIVDNLGIPASISRIYILNISPTGSSQCSTSVCIVDASPASPGFSNGNIREGEISHNITVTTGNGLAPINDGSGYKVTLATTRGRTFSFFYPWPLVIPPSSGGGPSNFVTNIGPLAIYFDFKSFNFTQGSQTQSQSAFCAPSSIPMVFWIKVANTASSNVIIKSQTMMQLQPYSANGFGQFVRVWIDDPGTVNPNTVIPYDEVNNPYNLAAAPVNGPGPAVILKFSASGQNGGGAQSMGRADNWLTNIGIYYLFNGQAQGQTIPFMDFRTINTYPSGC